MELIIFKRVYRTGCGSCLGVTSSGGSIYSSNYPNDNKDKLNCNIDINAPSDAKILLTFTEFVLEDEYDFVVVSSSLFILN